MNRYRIHEPRLKPTSFRIGDRVKLMEESILEGQEKWRDKVGVVTRIEDDFVMYWIYVDYGIFIKKWPDYDLEVVQ